MQSISSAGHVRTNSEAFRIERQQEGGYRLHVLGRMPIDWVGNLASGLARNGLSITRGKVFREGATGWHGHIALQSGFASTPPEGIDYRQLVCAEADRADSVLCIDSFILRPTQENGGALFVEIKGEDQHGFLGAFLGRLSFYSLFPVHMEIETTGGWIHDRFWLTAIGGGRPADAVVAALRGTLEKMATPLLQQ
jgi:hypothetical protein